MKDRILTLGSLFTSIALAACSGGTDNQSSGTTGSGGSSGTTGQTTGSGGATASSSGSGGGIPLGMPITAPPEQWTWVPFDNAFCANGSTTGIGVNLTDKSKRVIVYFEGGGACWSDVTCYTIKTAVNFSTGYDEKTFMSD